MVKEHKSSDNQGGTKTERLILSKATAIGLVLVVLIGVFGVGMVVCNNVSVVSDAAFAKRMDTAIESAEKWVESHKINILEKKNAALLKNA